VSFDKLLAEADFITIHTPLTAETRNLINKATIEKMKKGVYIINCARGGIVCEADLQEALASGRVGGAALDVFEEEPTKNRELLAMENLIATPHLGASTDEAQRNVAIAIAQQVADYFTKGEIRNAVNFPSVSGEILNLIRPFLTLAEKMGLFLAQTVKGGAEEVEITYSGDILDYNLEPMTIAFLKGLLTPILKENVNFINAPLIARDRGIRVIESRSSEAKDYKSMISVTMKTTQDKGYTAGTIFGQKDYRIVRINKFTLDVIPEGNMIVLYNYDKPGVIGNIGTTLGASNVNIARLHLSRQQVDGQALVVLTTDGTVPEEVIQRLRDLPNVISVNQLEL